MQVDGVRLIPDYPPGTLPSPAWDFAGIRDSVQRNFNPRVDIFYNDDYALACYNNKYKFLLRPTSENLELINKMQEPDPNGSRMHFHELQNTHYSTIMLMTNTTDRTDTIHPIDPYEYCTLPAVLFSTRYKFGQAGIEHRRFTGDFTLILKSILHMPAVETGFMLHMNLTNLCFGIARNLAECPLQPKQWLRINLMKSWLRVKHGVEAEHIPHEPPPVEIQFVNNEATFPLISYILSDNLYESLAITMAVHNMCLYADSIDAKTSAKYLGKSFFERFLGSEQFPTLTYRKVLILRRHKDDTKTITLQASLDIVLLLYPGNGPPLPAWLLERAKQDDGAAKRLIPELSKFNDPTPLDFRFGRG